MAQLIVELLVIEFATLFFKYLIEEVRNGG
jgi:hypothetical protein